MKLNSVQIKDRQTQIVKRCKEIVDTCKKEVREMTDEEQKEFEDSKTELEDLKKQLEEIKEKLAAYDNDVPSMEDDVEDMIEEGCENQNKKEERKKMQNFSITKEIRSAIENGSKRFTINADKRALTTSGSVAETEVQGILEPLYAKSVLAGVTQFLVKDEDYEYSFNQSFTLDNGNKPKNIDNITKVSSNVDIVFDNYNTEYKLRDNETL